MVKMHFIHPVLRTLAPFFFFFLAVEASVRFALMFYSWPELQGTWTKLFIAFFIGSAFDTAAFIYMAVPIIFYALVLPQRKHGMMLDRVISAILFFIFSYIVMFSAVGEWFFWDEFQSRYNFIAVDYLVYTTEVIGNIRESYPVGTLMGLMGVIAAGLSFAYYKASPRFLTPDVAWTQRVFGFSMLILVSILSYNTVSGNYAEISKNRAVNEIARNGIYELFSAYLNNELDYKNFYLTRPDDEVRKFLEAQIGSGMSASSPLIHKVDNKNSAKKYNLVLITVESLSARFLTEFGSRKNVTPYLDKLSEESLFFTNLYATGTRTVYGLSAITLSIPPVPGNAIVRRPENDNLFSLGYVLKTKGYDTKFIYGGYGYFDNMNKFFSGNGYKIIDRNNLTKKEINFANIWGVADDDLYRRVLKENDESFAAGKPFFDMVMTTSNHRPFTYPDGKIDIKSPGRREGGVKFTDYAIHEFLTEAKKRPWFKDTIFVIVADHTASSAGKTELDPTKYHIPMWIYAPGIVKPGRVDWMASQLDVAPTILGLMGVDYESRFYGKDLMKIKPGRAFVSNYQKLGYINKGGLVILEPVDQYNFYKLKDGDDEQEPDATVPETLLKDAIGYYQGASKWKEWSRQPKP